MKSTDKYKITIDTYNKSAEAFQEKFMDTDLYNDSYDAFCKLIRKDNAEILEIACGPGNVTRYLLKVRPDFSILAIDLSAKMIQLAKMNIPNAQFIRMDCRNISELNKKFDGIMCGFCLPYLSREDSVKLISDAAGLLRRNGMLYISTMEGDYGKSGFEATSFSGDNLLYIHYHQSDYLHQALITSGFEVSDVIRQDYPESDGSTSTDLIFIARRI